MLILKKSFLFFLVVSTPFSLRANPLFFSLSHRDGEGIGYEQGYTSLEFFAPYSLNYIGYPFFDGRVHIFNEGSVAMNLGMGSRFFSPSQEVIFGCNAFYDQRIEPFTAFHQLGVGLELFTSFWGLRLNGYFPVASRVGTNKMYLFDDYEGDYFALEKECFSSLPGANMEIEIALLEKGYLDLYLVSGGYYFSRRDESGFWGAEMGVEAFFYQLYSFNFYLSHDAFFGTKIEGKFSLNFALGTFWNSIYSIFPVRRHEIIPLERKFCWDWNY